MVEPSAEVSEVIGQPNALDAIAARLVGRAGDRKQLVLGRPSAVIDGPGVVGRVDVHNSLAFGEPKSDGPKPAIWGDLQEHPGEDVAGTSSEECLVRAAPADQPIGSFFRAAITFQ